MKQLLLLLSLIFSMGLSAQKNKDIDKFNDFIIKHDIRFLLTYSNDTSSQYFWKTVTKYDLNYNILIDVLDRKTDIAKEAFEKIYQYKGLLESCEYQSVYAQSDIFMKDYKTELYDNDKSIGPKNIYICNSSDINAYTTPFGKIYITDSLMSLLNFNHDEIFGVLAHEMTHHVLMHSLSSEYFKLRQESRNQALAGFAGALATAGTIAIASSSPYYSNNPNDTKRFYDDMRRNLSNLIYSIENASESATARFGYRYNRVEEWISDLYAYRFLQWKGFDPSAMSKALSKLCIVTPDDSSSRDTYLDHPRLSFRIKFLNYLHSQDYEKCDLWYTMYLCSNNKEILLPKTEMERLGKNGLQKAFPNSLIELTGGEDGTKSEYSSIDDLPTYYTQANYPILIYKNVPKEEYILRLNYLRYHYGTAFEMSFKSFRSKFFKDEQFQKDVYNKLKDLYDTGTFENFVKACTLNKNNHSSSAH